jgi:hypothetical protein
MSHSNRSQPRQSGSFREASRAVPGTDQTDISSGATEDELLIQASTPTQGHKKASQRFQDLWQNEEFRAQLAKIRRIRDPRRRNKRLLEFAYDNSLDFYLGSPLMDSIMDGKFSPEDPYLDFCQIVDEPDDLLGVFNYEDYEIPPKPFPDKKLLIENYPVHIAISPLATKRDVLDFVTKRWGEIRAQLDLYDEGEPIVRKRRKAKRDEYIWEHPEVPARILADMVCDNFPGELVTYADINSIRRYLRRRHSGL